MERMAHIVPALGAALLLAISSLASAQESSLPPGYTPNWVATPLPEVPWTPSEYGGEPFRSMQTPPPRVIAWGKHFGGSVEYSYEVRNPSRSFIRGFAVGFPDDPDLGLGITVTPEFHGHTFWVAPHSFRSPAGWGAVMHPGYESDEWSLSWYEGRYFKINFPLAAAVPEAPPVLDGEHAIWPGTIERSFAVTVPEVDFAYVSGHAYVTLVSKMQVPLEKGDSEPPRVTINVSRIQAPDTSGAWAAFRLDVTASDNYDPQPEVALEPVGADQHVAAGEVVAHQVSRLGWNVRVRNAPGRTYIFTANATDASGNVGTAVYRYTVGQ